MNGKINELSKYSQVDIEKTDLISDVFERFPIVFESLKYSKSEDAIKSELIEKLECKSYDVDLEVEERNFKYCPKCGREYPLEDNYCSDCLVILKSLEDKVDVRDIEADPLFIFNGENEYDDFEKLLDRDNIEKINQFEFSYEDFSQILHDIKAQAFKNFDEIVKTNEIDFDSLGPLDKIILFTKSFVKVDFKSFGSQLGYFEEDTIFIDDRQSRSLQITTLIHELSHFLIQEILIHVICRILNASRNSYIQSLVVFILSYHPFTQLIDEYAAHNVEGRFTIFGFQDYSSFIQIENSLDGEMTPDEIEITKSIGNTFALHIKDILESLIDRDFREEIKDQFLEDRVDRPNYKALKMENCQILNEEGFIKSLWLILFDGFETASENIDKLIQVNDLNN